MNLVPGNNPLYPTGDDGLRNPMRDDLDANHYDITNINQVIMSDTGAISGVVTINGQPYPPTGSIRKNWTWLYSSVASQGVNTFNGDQTSVSWENTVYNPVAHPVTLQNYTWPASGGGSYGITSTKFLCPVAGTYRVTATINGNGSAFIQTGSIGIYIDGAFSGGNIQNGSFANPFTLFAVTVKTLAAGSSIMIVGYDGGGGEYVTVGGTAAGGNVNLISTFQIEYLG
jgi:hypothetical protein